MQLNKKFEDFGGVFKKKTNQVEPAPKTPIFLPNVQILGIIHEMPEGPETPKTPNLAMTFE
jgi:hypothetical protein